MDIDDSLVINFWYNVEEQILQIEKEFFLPLIEEKRIFLEDYKQALLEFLDIFESCSFTKQINDHIPVSIDKDESLASMIFSKYSYWNKMDEIHDLNFSEEYDAVESHIDNLIGLSIVLPILNEFLNLFSVADSIEKFIIECIDLFSLSRFQIHFILSLSLSEIKNSNIQVIENEIDKYTAISEFILRLFGGFWERHIVEDNIQITYFYDSKKKTWENICKTEFKPSIKEYFWDKQNEQWELIEDYDAVSETVNS